jgi:hypothetical protein
VKRLKRFISLSEGRQYTQTETLRTGAAKGTKFQMSKLSTVQAGDRAFDTRKFELLTNCRAETWAVVGSITAPTEVVK